MIHKKFRKQTILSASTMIGNRVKNLDDESLGKIVEIMIDVDLGRVAYAVLSYGGFLGGRNKLFAIPWKALRPRRTDGDFVLDIDKTVLDKTPGFDKRSWPDMAHLSWGATIYSHDDSDSNS